MDLLELSQSGKTTYCNYKGTPSYWSARIGETLVENVAWSYQDPPPASQPIVGLLAFDGDKTEILADCPMPRATSTSGLPEALCSRC